MRGSYFKEFADADGQGFCLGDQLLKIRVDQHWPLAGAAHQCEQSHTLTAKRNQEYQGTS